jgi:hypothetical protein
MESNMDQETMTLHRFSAPTKMDTAPYGAQCTVIIGYVTYIYTQCSHDEEDPRWELTHQND